MLRRVPASVWALRAVIALGPLVAVFAGAPQGYTPSPFIAVLALVGGCAFALAPEHLVGTLVLGLVVVWWSTEVRTAMPLGAVGAAAALLATHVAALILGYGPPRLPVHRRLARRWLVRAVLVWLAAPVLWLAAAGYTSRSTPAGFWLAGLATALVGAVVAAVVLPSGTRASGMPGRTVDDMRLDPTGGVGDRPMGGLGRR